MSVCPDPQCGKEYEEIGIHWSRWEDHRPSFTQNQLDIIKGLLMGDGHLTRKTVRPKVTVSMTNKEYLEHLLDIFGILSTSVSQVESEHSDVWHWATRSHHELEQFKTWYTDEGKVWPQELDMNKTILTHWYCGDGYFDTSHTNKRVRISLNNEFGNESKVRSYFENTDVPVFDVWDETVGDNYANCEIRWYKQSLDNLFDALLDPVPGFEYKWPRGEYQ